MARTPTRRGSANCFGGDEPRGVAPGYSSAQLRRFELTRARADQFSNLTVKKIPKAVLSRCEYGHDDYSLRVENLPQAPPEPEQQVLFDSEGQQR